MAYFLDALRKSKPIRVRYYASYVSDNPDVYEHAWNVPMEGSSEAVAKFVKCSKQLATASLTRRLKSR
jgi:hypothetical protein